MELSSSNSGSPGKVQRSRSSILDMESQPAPEHRRATRIRQHRKGVSSYDGHAGSKAPSDSPTGSSHKSILLHAEEVGWEAPVGPDEGSPFEGGSSSRRASGQGREMRKASSSKASSQISRHTRRSARPSELGDISEINIHMPAGPISDLDAASTLPDDGHLKDGPRFDHNPTTQIKSDPASLSSLVPYDSPTRPSKPALLASASATLLVHGSPKGSPPHEGRRQRTIEDEEDKVGWGWSYVGPYLTFGCRYCC